MKVLQSFLGGSLTVKKYWLGSGTRCGREGELEDPKKIDVL
jgi:hypothetical protein